MPVINKAGYVNEHGQWWKTFSGGRRTRAYLAVCRHCRQRFPAYLTPDFCSKLCSVRSRQPKPLESKRCPHCRETFETRDARQVYCGHSCAAEAMHARRDPTTARIPKNCIKNADNPRFTRDGRGQWWYRPIGNGTHGRTRAFLLRCRECDAYYLADMQHVKKQMYCSKTCGVRAFCRANPDRWKGDRSARWKGGKMYRRGYVLRWCPEHPTVQGTQRRYVLEHRLVMEQHLGRHLKANEYVHHINGIRDDNRIENLELWVNGHPPGQREKEQRTKHCATCTCHLKGGEA